MLFCNVSNISSSFVGFKISKPRIKDPSEKECRVEFFGSKIGWKEPAVSNKKCRIGVFYFIPVYNICLVMCEEPAL